METNQPVFDKWIDVWPDRLDNGGLALHIRSWAGSAQPFVLLHGLASNARTWDAVARLLNAAGHAVIALDQRGHGLSAKPAFGYDFDTIAGDLARLLDQLALDRPIIAGQSWGGNVVLDFAARQPQRVAGLVLVDGGYIDLQSRPNSAWEEVAEQLRPPNLIGTPRSQLMARIRSGHPDWSDEGIEATLANFETMPDATVRPWLALENHMRILRAMWEQRPGDIYAEVQTPVLLAVAEDDTNPEWMALKRREVAAAIAALPNATIRWFAGAAHDIHVHRPVELAELMLEWSANL